VPSDSIQSHWQLFSAFQEGQRALEQNLLFLLKGQGNEDTRIESKHSAIKCKRIGREIIAFYQNGLAVTFGG